MDVGRRKKRSLRAANTHKEVRASSISPFILYRLITVTWVLPWCLLFITKSPWIISAAAISQHGQLIRCLVFRLGFPADSVRPGFWAGSVSIDLRYSMVVISSSSPLTFRTFQLVVVDVLGHTSALNLTRRSSIPTAMPKGLRSPVFDLPLSPDRNVRATTKLFDRLRLQLIYSAWYPAMDKCDRREPCPSAGRSHQDRRRPRPLESRRSLLRRDNGRRHQ